MKFLMWNQTHNNERAKKIEQTIIYQIQNEFIAYVMTCAMNINILISKTKKVISKIK